MSPGGLELEDLNFIPKTSPGLDLCCELNSLILVFCLWNFFKTNNTKQTARKHLQNVLERSLSVTWDESFSCCMCKLKKVKKNNSVSKAYWGPSSISINHAPLPCIKDSKKKKNLTHPYKHTRTLHLPTFVHIHKDTHHSHKLTRLHWWACTQTHTHTIT